MASVPLSPISTPSPGPPPCLPTHTIPLFLAFSLAAGFTAGLFPLCGLTAVLCTAVAFLLNVCGVPAHAPSMMAATFLATPFELSLIIPYMRLGEFIFQADRLSVSPSALVGALTGKSSSRLLMGLVHAVVAWLITSPFVTWILYRLLLPLTTRIKRRTGGVGIGSSWEGSEGGSISIDSGRGAGQLGASGSGQLQLQRRPRETLTSQQLHEWYAQSRGSLSTVRCPYVIRTGDRTGQTCGTLSHTQSRCFAHLSDAWRTEFGDEAELPDWVELLGQRVDIFALDYDAILTAMYALPTSADNTCYLCAMPDPGIEPAALGASEAAALGTSASPALVAGEAAALGAGESALFGTAPAEALYTFTLDSGASRSFFRDSITLTPLSRPVPVSLADPSGNPVLARSSTVLPCLAVPSGSLLYTQTTVSPQVAASASASGQLAAPCSCRALSHQTLLWHHRLGHPSVQRLRSMHRRVLVSRLPRVLPPLPPSPAPPCLPCVEGQQRAAPHSSLFPPTEAPLQTLHLDVWGPARVRGQGHERYFLLVVDDYTRYTTVFPLRTKGEVPDVLIPWIRAARLQLRERFGTDFPILRLHSDRGGEFSSDLLAAFCAEHGIRQTFTLPASPQQNGVAERRIGLVMEPRVSLPETSPTLLWTGKVGDASRFRVWGARAFVRDTTADKLSACTVPCVFLGFVPDAPGWQFYHPTSRRVFPSHDVTFDELVPFYRVSQVDPPPLTLPVEVTGDSGPTEGGPARGAASGGAEPGGAEPGGAEPGDAEPGREESRGAEPGGTEPGGTAPGGAAASGEQSPWSGCLHSRSAGTSQLHSRRRLPLSPQQLCEWYVGRQGRTAGARSPAAGGAKAGDTATGVVAVGGSGAAEGAGARVCRAAEGAGAGGSGAAAGVGTKGSESAVARSPWSSRLHPRVPLTSQQLHDWYGRRQGRASGARGSAAGGTSADVTGAGSGAGPGGARTGGTGAAGAGGAELGGAAAGGAGPGGAGAEGSGAAGGTGTAGGPGAAGAGSTAQPRLFFTPRSPSSQPPSDSRREPATRPVSPVRSGRSGHSVPCSCQPAVPGTHLVVRRPSSPPQSVPLPSPPASSLPTVPEPESDRARAAHPTVTRLLATAVTDPSFESAAASALVVELVDFAAACRLDYATSLVAESASVCPPSVGGECALGTDVLEDRHEDLECLAAAAPHLVSMLLALEGDPDAPHIPTPRSYAETITGPYSSQWQIAMDAEMASWKSTGTYVDDIPPPGANIVSGMWIFRVKRLPGSPPVFKARYVARGLSQREGVDFFQTFSPTPKMTTLRVLLHVAAQRDYELHSLDFSTAFLQGSLHEEIWLRRPRGFTGSFPPGTQLSLRRPVYGLRHAPREWHDTLRTTLAALGFAPSTADPSLFLRTDTSLPPFYILVYVDDLVFATADTEALALVKSELQKRHTCTDVGELRSYLGLQITRDRARRTITLTQSHMVHQVFQRFGFTWSSVQATPLATGHSLSAPPSDESVEPSGPYPELVGCLMYLMTCTRPDLAYPLGLLACYVAPGRHRKVHMDAAKRVLRYLCSTSGMGLVLGGRGDVVLTGHSDASWVDDQTTKRSSQGYTFSLGSGSVSWRSTCSSSVLSSNCEAEIYSTAMAAQELRWLTYLLTDLGERPRSPPVLYVDNKAAIALCQEHKLEHRTKHIALRYFLARELQQRGQLRLAHVTTRANTADIFTKALPPGDHQRFCTLLGLVPTLPHLL
ncbi:unnamed protein product [Closterium sp. NIES-53]